jgi:hypothetical protein
MATKRQPKMAGWAREYLENYKPPTQAQIRRRKKAVKRALEIREKLDIRPLTTAELIRQIRDEGE